MNRERVWSLGAIIGLARVAIGVSLLCGAPMAAGAAAAKAGLANEKMWLVPWVVRVQGVNTFFNSEVLVFNSDPREALSLELALSLSNVSGVALQWLGAGTISPQRTLVVPDIVTYVGTLGGPVPAGSVVGTLFVRTSGASSQPVVLSRTYTSVLNQTFGTLGMSFSAIPAEKWFTPETGEHSRTLIGIRGDQRYRTNLMLTNPTGTVLTLGLDYYYQPTGSSRERLQSDTVQIPPSTFSQIAQPTSQLGKSPISVLPRVVQGSAFWAAASLIDNISGDAALLWPSLNPGAFTRTPGVTEWAGGIQTEVTIYNASSRRRDILLSFTGTGASATKLVSFEPWEMRMIEPALTFIFGSRPQDVTGYLDVGPADFLDSDPVLVQAIVRRPFGGGFAQTQLSTLGAGDAVSPSTPARKRLFIAGLESDKYFKSAISLVLVDRNPDSVVSGFLNVFDNEAKLRRSVPITVSGRQPYVEKRDQELFGDLCAGVTDRCVYSVILDGVTGSGAVAGFGTVIDRVTGDSFISPGVTGSSCVPGSKSELLTPADQATKVESGTLLTWTPASAAFRYDVYLDTVNPPVKVVTAETTTLSYAMSNLQAGTRYYWKVVAKGDPACTPMNVTESEVHSFTTAGGCPPPGNFSLTSPVTGTVDPASVALTWAAAPGASAYSLYLGTTNPPPFVKSGIGTTSTAVTGLVGGATYYWNVMAEAGCDPTKRTSSGVASFKTTGTCQRPATFSLESPVSGATGVGKAATLSWKASANAGSYDLYLGIGTDPPLYWPNLTQTSVAVTGLLPGAAYTWKVIAKTSCDPDAAVVAGPWSFTVSGTCTKPQAPGDLFTPPGNVGVGQTYVIAWASAADLDTGGGYVVERSLDAGFSPVLDRQVVLQTTASFVADRAGTIYHRVRAIPGCDPAKEGPNTPAKAVTVIAANANVVFTLLPEPVIVPIGEAVGERKGKLTIENISQSPVTVLVTRQELNSVPFFQVVDPEGSSTGFVVLEPRKPKTLEVRFSGVGTEKAATYQGLVVVSAIGTSLPVTPYAFVNLKVGGTEGAAPKFRFRNVETEYAFFPGHAGDDSERGPIEIEVVNPGATPMELGAQIGPEVWLEPEANWNATPIPPGMTRVVKLTTKRNRAPNGSALPRYTYLTLRTKGGLTSRLLVQDNDAPVLGQGRTALERGVASHVVLSAASAMSAIGNLFQSRLKLSNSSTEAVQAEIYLTPPGKDGYDVNAFQKAVVVVPPNDVVNLTDPLVQLFGMSRPAVGSLEVRTNKPGALSVTSGVDAPSETGGTFGFQMPVVRRGQGARLGSPQGIAGITATPDYRTNLIMAETTGIDAVDVNVTLYSRDGQTLGDRKVTVPRYGMAQINQVVRSLEGGETEEAASLELSVLSGGGAIASLATVIDNRNDDAVTYTGKPLAAEVQGLAGRSMKKPVWATASGTQKVVIPSIVSGYTQQLPGTGESYMFQSLMGFQNLTKYTLKFQLTYRDLAVDANDPVIRTKTVEVRPRQTIEYKNVIEELFEVSAGQGSQGPVFVEQTGGGGVVYTKVFSRVAEKGSFGDAFPVIPLDSEGLTGGLSQRPIEIDGLEQAFVETSSGAFSERVRGKRSNLILNEVIGKPVTVRISLYEPGNRLVPIAERDFELKALQRLQLNTVFSALGLAEESRRKDRTNVKCIVQAIRGEGMASAVVTTIDNRTADTQNGQMLPSGASSEPGSPVSFGN